MQKRILLVLTMAFMFLTGCRQTVAEMTGLEGGRLRPCPDRPNCVCTQETDERHRIEPIRFEGTREEARDRLLALIGQMDRATIAKAGADYIHVEFRSAVFRFVDDVEFLIDETAGLIHFRSASRAGYYDFKVNRRRMEDIRRRFAGPR